MTIGIQVRVSVPFAVCEITYIQDIKDVLNMAVNLAVFI